MTGSDEEQSSGALLDADALLNFTDRMHDLRERVDDAEVTDAQRGRWQRKLLLLTEAAHRDLEAAREQLARFEAEFERRGE